MNIVIAIDKFKGSATQEQLSSTIEKTIKQCAKDAHIIVVPVADGGDGTMQAIHNILGNQVKTRKVRVQAPVPHLPSIDAEYLIDKSTGTAFMDLATASGLALVPPDKRKAMRANTAGTGVVIAHAINNGARHIIMGLGGSATTDCGTGILWALGVRFLDKNGMNLPPCGEMLNRIHQVDTSRISDAVRATRFTLLTDVDNPLHGPNGAAYVYAPQKGASERQVVLLDKGLKHLANLMPADVPETAGAGAAGGVAAGMMAWLDATIKPGIDTMLEMAKFDEILDNADLVITGEGRIDRQTMMGKAPAGVLKAAQRHDIPVIALCGSIAPDINVKELGFTQVIPITPTDMPIEQAMDTTTTLHNVEAAVAELITHWELSHN